MDGVAGESAGAGPQVQVLISDAEGLEAGKTPVRVRNVDVGLVSDISLNDDERGSTDH